LNALTFDTHAFIKRLMSSGMPEAQAETVSDLVKESQDSTIATLATKADLCQEIVALKADIGAETAPLKAELLLLKWMVGTVLVLVLGVFAKLYGH